MKDIRGNIIKSGQTVHIFGENGEYKLDINAVVVNTRGKGVKFINEVDGKEYLAKHIEENNFSVVILTDNIEKEEEKFNKSNNKITQDQLDIIQKLIDWGWYGILYKNVNGNKYQINITEK